MQLSEHMKVPHDNLGDQQKWFRTHASQEPPLFEMEKKVWLQSKCKSKHKNLKLLPKFVESFTILKVDDVHSYLIEQNGKVSRESESRLKAYFSCTNIAGRAPRSEEPNHQPTRQGMQIGRKRRQTEMSDLKDLLEHDVHFSWEIGFAANVAKSGEHSEVVVDNFTDLVLAEAEPLIKEQVVEDKWQRVTFNSSGHLSKLSQLYA